MRDVRPIGIRAACSILLFAGAVGLGVACGPEINFRAYLRKTLWHPAFRDWTEVLAGLPPENDHRLPYAGMANGGANGSLQTARDAYRALFPEEPDPYSNTLNWPAPVLAHVRDLVNAVRPANDAETAELDLLRCKVELRAAKPDDKAALSNVRSCFETFLAPPRAAALTSEARGWMARADFLLGHDAAAAKFYLAELASPASNISRERLLNSLLAIEPRAETLDVYFDTPAHALFVANRITNSDNREELVAPLIARLEQHRDLFARGTDSDDLAIALMRAATKAGDPSAALRYAARVRPDGPGAVSAEYNWMLGAARFQQRDFAGAEKAFKAVLKAKDVDDERKALAANGLIGVYARLRRPADQLWAAFEASGPHFGLQLDAPYLLDVQLTDVELQTYLRRYPDASVIIASAFGDKSSLDAVRYALAVRHARREEYAQAARLCASVNPKRAARMKEAERLFAATRAPDAAGERHLQALYAYASFLADHEDGIFFNDMVWRGFQTAAFVYRDPDTREADYFTALNAATVSTTERARLAASERRLRDEQEEYWRAYKILNEVVTRAGPTPLGKRAAARALSCLRRISVERFGRAKEIRAADIRLTNWLSRRGD
jgi:hypothetical protein